MYTKKYCRLSFTLSPGVLLMVKKQSINNIRPAFSEVFDVHTFKARTDAIAAAYRLGKELHAGQKRFSGEPYFETHCVWVAGFLDNLVHNEAWTIAALLHDSVEDRGGSLDQIRTTFPGELGEEVAYIVDGVTKLSAPQDGWSRELESLRKLTMYRDPGVFLVKLADKSHNMMTLKHMPDQAKRQQKATEAIRAYGKLAGILNCYEWRRWLEDMAFPYADPDTYSYVKSRIDQDSRLKPDFLNSTVEQLAKLMEKSGLHGKVEITVNGYWQSWQKLRRQAYQRTTSLASFTGLNDMVSFRMILDSKDERDCYALLYSVNRYLGPYLDQNRFDDYIAYPQNGYRALQVTAYLPDHGAIEVAIMTDEMEGENRWGIVYSIQNGKDIGAYRPMAILTPSGGVRFLPEGSTVLDGVASIQQEILLDKISSVEVNGNLARLSDKIKAGDIVEVITGPGKQTPSEEWLSFCNEATARMLRSVLITASLKKSAEQGRQAIKMVLKQHGILSRRCPGPGQREN
jgi:GTP diphosphokinase / guanosine-3',5'-bis(diphosphate) 3'-diphosphatase